MQPKILRKAKKIVTENRIRVEKITKKAVYFRVRGDTNTYSVIFDKESNKWSCDCQYSSLHPRPDCSHRLACKLLGEKLAYDGHAKLWDIQVKFTPMSKAKPEKNLLTVALEKLNMNWNDVPSEDRLKDDYGIFGVVMKDFVLVAKDYVMGHSTVSCHKRALYSALNQKKPLIMFLNEEDAFFEFRPEEVLDKYIFENFKGTSVMVNFSIGLGRKILHMKTGG